MHYARKRRHGTVGLAKEQREKPNQVCSVVECGKKAYGKSLCSKHWQRLRAKGTLEDPPSPKIGCKILKCTSNHFAKDMCEKHYMRQNWLIKAYGITMDDLLEKIKVQDNRCSICKNEFDLSAPQFIHVDHSHSTGKVRDILCHYCNTGLGMFKENSDFLKSAIKYLKKHSN